MREYGKLATRIWTDPRFMPLSTDAKLVFIYLLSGPETNAVGCFRCTPMNIAASEVCSIENAAHSLDELSATGIIKYDQTVKVVFLPRFLKYNPICNPSAGKAAGKALNQIPETPLIAEVIEFLKPFEKHLPVGWAQVATQVSRQVSASYSYSDSYSDSDSHQDTEGEQDSESSPRWGSPPPSLSQISMISEMAAERDLGLAEVSRILGHRIGRKDVSVVKDWLRSQPIPDPPTPRPYDVPEEPDPDMTPEEIAASQAALAAVKEDG